METNNNLWSCRWYEKSKQILTTNYVDVEVNFDLSVYLIGIAFFKMVKEYSILVTFFWFSIEIIYIYKGKKANYTND